ncbi:MAG TPA: CaiB/BaiF CoA-transferase family protein [Rhodocyclaceae bacterium]|nr:CaiB/BaiF CoA-transferase family protein [Rhodocyclaceae bacterium]HRQ47384.1 CaiB/BaiF CoA-transferase family protein [Rhodocyclaceae bacterium]
MHSKPLEGLRVLDLTRLLPGPLATQHLADHGAEVIKIEDTGAGDYARSMGPMHGESSYFFQVVNRNKRSLNLDLKQDRGRELFLRLAATADVLVEGFRPGVMHKLGLDYETVARANPRIVYCSISGYGQNGPFALRAGHDINYIGYAGVLDQTGTAGGAPAIPNLQIGDLLGGTLCSLVGMLIAIIDARATGSGRHVDIAMSDGVLAHAIFPLLEVLSRGAVRPRGDDLLTGGVPCYGVYETADGRHMAVGALEAKFWHAVCDTLGRADLKAVHVATGEEGARAKALVADIFRARTQAEWIALFDGVDCCVTPVLTLEESLENAQVQARGMVTDVGGVRQFAAPFGLSGLAPEAWTPAPGAGADSDDLLGQLGLTPDEIVALRRTGVI